MIYFHAPQRLKNEIKYKNTNHIMNHNVYFKKTHPDAVIPTRATKYSAGFDLYALEDTPVYSHMGVTLVKTGVAVKLPSEHYGRIAMRSGHSLRQHMICTAGVIDYDFRSSISVLVSIAFPNHSYIIKKGERFAQLVVEKIFTGDAIEVQEFDSDDISISEHKGYSATGLF